MNVAATRKCFFCHKPFLVESAYRYAYCSETCWVALKKQQFDERPESTYCDADDDAYLHWAAPGMTAIQLGRWLKRTVERNSKGGK